MLCLSQKLRQCHIALEHMRNYKGLAPAGMCTSTACWCGGLWRRRWCAYRCGRGCRAKSFCGWNLLPRPCPALPHCHMPLGPTPPPPPCPSQESKHALLDKGGNNTVTTVEDTVRKEGLQWGEVQQLVNALL